MGELARFEEPDPKTKQNQLKSVLDGLQKVSLAESVEPPVDMIETPDLQDGQFQSSQSNAADSTEVTDTSGRFLPRRK